MMAKRKPDFIKANLRKRTAIGLIACAVSIIAPQFSLAQDPYGTTDMGTTALRAPLNIIPPAMQQAIGGKAKADVSGQKLAPRIAARQSKRAVRAVAAAPGSASGIVQVGSLGTLQDAPVGLEDGFGMNLWRGARLAFIADQMARLPNNLQLAGLRKTELTLHRGATAAPVGTVDGTSWYAARLNRFLALGDTGSVLALENLTGAAKTDAFAAAALAQAHLGSGNYAAACSVQRPTKRVNGYSDTLAFFMRLMVFCQLRDGEFEKVGLALELNERTLGADKLFRDIAYLMAAQVPPVFGTAAQAKAARAAGEDTPIVLPSELTPLQIAILQLAGQRLPSQLTKFPPFMAAALAGDYSQAPLIQLRAAHQLAVNEPNNAELFSQVAQLADITAWPDPYGQVTRTAPSNAETDLAQDASAAFPENLPPVVFFAYSLRLVDATPPEAQARIIADILRNASDIGLWRDMVLLLADRLVDLPLTAAQNNMADEAPMAIAPADMAVLIPALRYAGLEAKAETLVAQFVLVDVAQRLLSFGREAAQVDDVLAALSAPEATIEPTIEAASQAIDATQIGTAIAAQPDGAYDMARAATGLMASLAQDAEQGRVHPIVDFAAYEARLLEASPAVKQYMLRELAVYAGLGFELSPSLTQIIAPVVSDPSLTDLTPESVAQTNAPLDDAVDAPQIEKPVDSARMRLDKLATNKWVGDLVLALVAQYGSRTPALLSDREIVTILSSLRKVGLEAEADNLAIELLALAAADLSLLAPQAFIAAGS